MLQAIDKAFERNAALLNADEQWAKGYYDAPEQYAKMLKVAARLERKILLFFKEQAATSNRFINWYAYANALQEVHASKITAYDVNVIVNDNVSDDDTAFISIIFDEVAVAMSLGAQAGETIYKLPLGLDATDSAIQRQARKQVAELVGRRVLDDGSVVTNPNADYVISNTTRKKIQESIHTSITLGEDVQAATKRVQAVIKNPVRAALIARQEMAMAYTSGLHHYGQASGAIGKEWFTNGAKDICLTNALAGPIPFNKPYPSGVQHPTAHIGCRCYERLIYQNELTQHPDLFDKPTPKAPTPPAPKPTIKPKDVTLTHNGVSKTIEITPNERNFIEKSNLKIELDTAGNNLAKTSQGSYSPTEHKLLLRTPDKVLKGAGFKYEHTFYHELGHAMDYRLVSGTALNSKYRSALIADRQAVANNRLLLQGNDEETSKQFAAGSNIAFKTAEDGTAKRYRMTKSFITYLRSNTEVWADGYAQYRTNPTKFAKYAPNLAKAYKEIN